MSEQSDDGQFYTSTPEGFGQRLKAAREVKKLSIADISARLHLDEDVIQALEDYDYEALPEPMFVCGYIRNYSKLLNIPPEPLVAFYKNEIEGNLIPTLDVKNESRNARSYSLGKFLPLIFLFTIAGFIFAGWLWWQSNSDEISETTGSWFNFNKTSPEKSAQGGTELNVDSADPSQLQLPEYTEEPLLPQINDSDTSNTLIEKEASVVEAEQLQQAQPLAEPAAADNQTQTRVSIAETLPATPEPAISRDSLSGNTVVTASATTPATAQNAAADNKLVLDFSSDSWIRIRDADGKILAKDLKKKGTQLQLEGKRPYYVFLGDATGVTVRINNTIFDHSSYINDKKIARFVVK